MHKVDPPSRPSCSALKTTIAEPSYLTRLPVGRAIAPIHPDLRAFSPIGRLRFLSRTRSSADGLTKQRVGARLNDCALTVHGFLPNGGSQMLSHVDQLYYDNPSFTLAGFMAHHLLRVSKNDTIELRAGFPLNACKPLKEFSSLQELLGSLRAEHRSAYRYRGQTNRYSAVTEGRVAQLVEQCPRANPLRINYEALVASALRPVFRSCPAQPAAWAKWTSPRLFDQIAPAVRAVCNSDYEPIKEFFLDVLWDIRLVGTARAVQHELPVRLRAGGKIAAPGTEIPFRLLQFISLSQHYEYGSVMIDFSGEPNVAAWFASHNWDGSLANGTGFGVIYRFDLESLNEVLNRTILGATATGAQIANLGPMGAADISLLDPSLGARPHAQVGGGLFGAEHSVFAQILCTSGDLTTFVYPKNSLVGNETPYTKDTICPPNDPLLTVFTDQFKNANQQIPDAELAALIKSVNGDAEMVDVLINLRSIGEI
jgi:hypothetical protein